jgi:hypothetical protein
MVADTIGAGQPKDYTKLTERCERILPFFWLIHQQPVGQARVVLARKNSATADFGIAPRATVSTKSA